MPIQDEHDKKLYELLQEIQQRRIKNVLMYTSKWLFHGHIFEAEYYVYVSH
jgi:hypothetical protein